MCQRISCVEIFVISRLQTYLDKSVQATWVNNRVDEDKKNDHCAILLLVSFSYQNIMLSKMFTSRNRVLLLTFSCTFALFVNTWRCLATGASHCLNFPLSTTRETTASLSTGRRHLTCWFFSILLLSMLYPFYAVTSSISNLDVELISCWVRCFYGINFYRADTQ